jgi:branched-chain amino acid transport system substrate-binding protein
VVVERFRLVTALVVAVGVLSGGCGRSQPEAVRIGVLAACDGIWGYWYDGSLAATELPLLERGARLAGSKPRDGLREAAIAGRPVELVFGCGDGLPEVALSETRRLVEVEDVDLLIGATTLAEAFAIRSYAVRHPEVTFVVGSASGQAITLRSPPENLFRFTPAGTQWMAGLGSYAYHDLGWRRAVTLGDEWSFSYLLTSGFAAEFCSLGGTIVKSLWLPPGGDPDETAATVPRRGVDGFVATGFPHTNIGLIQRIPHLRGSLGGRLIGTGVALTEPAVVEALGKRLRGVVYSDPTPPGRSTSNEFVAGMARYFPGIGEHVQRTAPPLYFTAAKAVVRALEAVEADLSGGQQRFRDALSRLEVDGAGGRVRLDSSRQAIATNYLLRYEVDGAGKLAPRVLRRVPNVEQTFNGYFRPRAPLTGRDAIECRRGNPPPWARR